MSTTEKSLIEFVDELIEEDAIAEEEEVCRCTSRHNDDL